MVRSPEERRGKGSQDRSREMREFNEFIGNSNLVDLPLGRRKFTWYRDNVQSCSRLDRFLLSTEWMGQWPILVQLGMKRKIFDHAAVLLKDEVKDWGPKPFKFLNAWTKKKGFLEMVEKEWKLCRVEGWAGFVIREKLKSLKDKI